MNADLQPAGDPPFLTIEYVAELLGLSVATIRRAIRDKKLKSHRFGRAIRISSSDFDTFIAKSRE